MADTPKQHHVEKEPIPGISEDAIRNGSITAGGVSEQILEHSHDADAAMKAFASYQGQVLDIDEATNKRLLRKIDWHLMPVRQSYGSIRAYRADMHAREAPLHSLRSQLLGQDHHQLCLGHGLEKATGRRRHWHHL